MVKYGETITTANRQVTLTVVQFYKNLNSIFLTKNAQKNGNWRLCFVKKFAKYTNQHPLAQAEDLFNSQSKQNGLNKPLGDRNIICNKYE